MERVLDETAKRNMPSKKKGKGKARRAAKSRTELKNDAGTKNDVKNVELKMQRLQINNDGKTDEDALLEEAINLAAAEREKLDAAATNDERCDHGFVPLPRGHVCKMFIQSFAYEFNASKKNCIYDRFLDAWDATEKYIKVWRNPDMLQLVVSYFLAKGTDSLILELEKDDLVRQSVLAASFFENRRAELTGNTEVIGKTSKICDLSDENCDEHTLVSYFRNRIPCKCLDKRYKKVKSIVKTGNCHNEGCLLPNGKAERSTLMHCNQCRLAQYCSIECQKAHWPTHKEQCARVCKR